MMTLRYSWSHVASWRETEFRRGGAHWPRAVIECAAWLVDTYPCNAMMTVPMMRTLDFLLFMGLVDSPLCQSTI